MNDFDVWLTIALMTIATILTRGSFYLLGDSVRLPASVQHALRYAPAAALAAIIAPDILVGDDHLQLDLHNPKLMAAVVATVFYLASKHLLGTIAVGMLCFSLARLYL